MTTINCATGTTATPASTNVSTPAILNSSGSLNTNTQLYTDLYNAEISRANVNKLLGSANSNPEDIRVWQDHYEDDANKYKLDLNNVVNTYKGSAQAADAKYALGQLTNFSSNFGAVSLFVNPNTTQGPTPRKGADAFPGGVQDDDSGIFEGPLKKGYVPPPAFSSGSNIKDVYENLTDDQAGYLGWALQQGVQGKELTMPAGADNSDLQKWNALATYASQNDRDLKVMDSNPVPADEWMTPNDADTDLKVYSSFWYNRPQNLGTILMSGLTSLGQALDPISPVANAIGGTAGEIVDIVGGVAMALIPGVGEERFAGLEISAAAKTAEAVAATSKLPDGAIDAATGLGKRISADAADGTAATAGTTTGDAAAGVDLGASRTAFDQAGDDTQGFLNLFGNGNIGRGTVRDTPDAAIADAESKPLNSDTYRSENGANPNLPSGTGALVLRQGKFEKGAWGAEGTTLEDFQQAALGSCQTNASMMALQMRKFDFNKSLEATGPGDYAFHGYDPNTGAALTVGEDSTLPMDAATGSSAVLGGEADGIGGGLMMKGIAKIFNYTGADDRPGWDAIQGVLASKIARTLLPESAIKDNKTFYTEANGYMSVRDFRDNETLNADGKTATYDPNSAWTQMRDRLQANLASPENFATVSFPKVTKAEDKAFLSANGLYDGHAYAVKSYDPNTDELTLLDPNFSAGGKTGVTIKLKDLVGRDVLVYA